MAKPIFIMTFPNMSADVWESMENHREHMQSAMPDYYVIFANDPHAQSIKYEVLNGEFTQTIVQMADQMEGVK